MRNTNKIQGYRTRKRRAQRKLVLDGRCFESFHALQNVHLSSDITENNEVITRSRIKPRTFLSHLQFAHTTKTSLKTNCRSGENKLLKNSRYGSIGDPRLTTVDDVPAIYFLSSSLHTSGIRAVVGFSQTLYEHENEIIEMEL